MLDLPVNNISGIGTTMVKVLNENSIYYVRDALCEKFSLNRLKNMFDDRIGRFLFLALFKKMNVNLDRQSEEYIREMIRRNRLYGTPSEFASKVIASFYK